MLAKALRKHPLFLLWHRRRLAHTQFTGLAVCSFRGISAKLRFTIAMHAARPHRKTCRVCMCKLVARATGHRNYA